MKTPEPQTLSFKGYAFIEKEVKNSGDSGRVFVPKAWVGKKAVVILLEPIDDTENK